MLACLVAPVASAQENGDVAAQGASEPASELQLLLDVLNDEASRARLIEELESATAGAAETPVEAVDDALPGTSEISIGRRIAETTSYFAEAAANSLGSFLTQLTQAPQIFSALDADQIGIVFQALWDLALTIIATYALYFVLRRFAQAAYLSLGVRSARSGFLQRAVFIVVSALLDVLVVVVAWAAGYVIALAFFGDVGTMGLRQSLYLNAFLAVELAKVVLRIVLSPSTADLRLLPVANTPARYMSRGFSWIIAILGYGQLLLLPIFTQNVSSAAGQAISAFVSLVALMVAVFMTVSNRQEVANWLLDTPEDRPRNRHLRFLARRWHWPVLLYLAFLFIIVIAGPAGLLLGILAASGRILLAVIVGFAVTGWIARAIARGIDLPEHVNQRLPFLEQRLNAFVPKFLTVLRVAVFLIVLLFVLDTVNFLDIRGWLQTQIGIRATTALISVFLIVLVAFACWLALNSWVDYRLNPDFGRPASIREQTLLSLLRNAATIAILVIALMFALSEMGINIAPLIASAGVLGLAIGFGAQKMVQDIITGIFIQLENSMDVGDVVTLGATTGTVERLTIRSVSLRDLDGSYHVIPFSSVDVVTNYMRGFGYHVAEIRIGYRENIEEAREAIVAAFEELRKDPELARSIIGDMEWFGVQSLTESAVLVRARIKAVAGMQWGVGRAFNGIVKRIFDERGIEIPFPHQTVYFGEDKRGRAPSAHIVVEQNVANDKEQSEGQETETSAGSKRRRRSSVRDNKAGIPASDDAEGSR